MRSAEPPTCTLAEVGSPFKDGHERDDAALQKVDLLDLLARAVQQVAGEENHLAKVGPQQG